MRLNFNTQMLERMSEGVVLLDRQAQVVGHNSASGAWVSLCKDKSTVLKILIDQAAMGRVELPVKLNLFSQSQADGVPAADAWLCKDGLQNYAVFLSPYKTPVINLAVAESRYVSLLGEEVRGQMQQLRVLLQKRHGVLELDEDTFTAQCIYVETLLKEVADLSMLMQRAHPFDDERIEMDLLLRAQLPRLQKQFENPFVFNPSSVKQGVLYGNSPWLSYALRALLAELGDGAPPGSEIVITMHQMGGFLVLTGKVAGLYVMNLADRPKGSVYEARKPVKGFLDSAPMLMAKRIIDLHTGKLKINFLQCSEADGDAGEVIESFTLTIPTGVSSQQPTNGSCSKCPIAQQAQIYATDIAILLAEK